MTYLNIAKAAEDADFGRRVHACLYKLAGDVLNESVDTPNHAERLTLARNVRRFGLQPARFSWECASNATIADGIVIEVDGSVTVPALDSDLEFVCSSAWDEIALSEYGPSA